MRYLQIIVILAFLQKHFFTDYTHLCCQTYSRTDHHGWIPRRPLSHGAPHLDPRTPCSDAAAWAGQGSLGLHPGCGQRLVCRGGLLRWGPEPDGDRWPASVSRKGLEGAVASEPGGGEGVREPVQGPDRLLVLPPQRFPLHPRHLRLVWRRQSRWALQRWGRPGLLGSCVLGPGESTGRSCVLFPVKCFTQRLSNAGHLDVSGDSVVLPQAGPGSAGVQSGDSRGCERKRPEPGLQGMMVRLMCV